ncbi:MAG TPA: hypothetical protein DCS23_02415 [Candidatus Yonathbacteria bacterium]|nr:hypothetical protein [Candidatus Yonathbacteria bacterium]
MSGISMLTAMEINNHPNDLYIQIGREVQDDKYAFMLSRGKEHNFKLLIITIPFAETIDEAVEEVKNLLNGIHEAATKELQNKESILANIINSGGHEVDVSKTLNHNLISMILDELRKNHIVNTYDMLANV